MTTINRTTRESAGVELEAFSPAAVLGRLRHELAAAARGCGLELRILPCSLSVRSDRRVLEDIIRALFMHALDHVQTERVFGKIVIGCRRRGSVLRIGVLCVGPGTEYPELQVLLADIGAPVSPVVSATSRRGRETELARAQRLAQLLGHKVGVRLFPQAGSFLYVDVQLPPAAAQARGEAAAVSKERQLNEHGGAGPRLSGARSADRRSVPSGAWELPADNQGDDHAVSAPPDASAPMVYVVDDDPNIRSAICTALGGYGWAIETFEFCEAFLKQYRPGRHACLTLDAYLPGMNGLELMQRLGDADQLLPTIMLTGNGDVSMAVQAMKSGVLDFIQKPISRRRLVSSVEMALKSSREITHPAGMPDTAAAGSLSSLTERQRQIMTMILAGQPNKIIAATLGISQRTVESHRAQIMKKTGSKSLAALARLALTATWHGAEGALHTSQAAIKAARAARMAQENDDALHAPRASQLRRP